MVRNTKGRKDWPDSGEQERRPRKLRDSGRKRIRGQVQRLDDYEEFDDWQGGRHKTTRSRNLRGSWD